MSVSVPKSDAPSVLPPMLQQYVEYKELYPDCLLLFQVGDFYELFFDDAVTVAKTLNLTLTSRDKNSPNPIPMCGVPIGVVENYIERLVKARYSVAIVSQKTLPPAASPSGKQTIVRYLERIITPGIKILGNHERDSDEAPVAAIYPADESDVAIAFSDVQSGKILIRENISLSSLVHELGGIQPVEIILPAQVEKRKIDRRLAWVCEIERSVPYAGLKTRAFSQDSGSSRIGEFGAVKGYSALGSAAKKALQLLVGYMDETTVNVAIPIREIEPVSYTDLMVIDATTRRNLELVKNTRDGTSEGTLFDFLNFTLTAGGERILRKTILHPYIKLDVIRERQELTKFFLENHSARRELRDELRYIADLERLAARLELGIVLPRELVALRRSLESARRIESALAALPQIENALFAESLNNLSIPAELLSHLSSIAENPDAGLNQGGIIRAGFNAELDRLRAIKTNGTGWIAELEGSEKARTGISSLKIKYNNVIGYFIEITSANLSKVPDDYIRKQSTANGERFTTHELRAREKEIVNADSKVIELERALFEELREKLKPYSQQLRVISSALAIFDLAASFAECSERYDLRRPELDAGADFEVKEGKHPILLKLLRESFVPTDILMVESGKNFLIITGPNMGGKSTYLRQAALIAILAQSGCFVPSKFTRLGIVDRIFARLGASDNQREGESTFMVEMREASHIVSSATPRSLVLIDEIGRGTATADGLALAQAIVEWLVDKVGCRTLFATHFHELTELETTSKRVANFSVGSYEKGGEVIFTHSIVAGAASSSYGLEVAKLAGLPAELITRAKEVLQNRPFNNAPQLSLFAAPAMREPVGDVDRSAGEMAKLKELRNQIEAVDLNSITPLEALNLLSKLAAEC